MKSDDILTLIKAGYNKDDIIKMGIVLGDPEKDNNNSIFNANSKEKNESIQKETIKGKEEDTSNDPKNYEKEIESLKKQIEDIKNGFQSPTKHGGAENSGENTEEKKISFSEMAKNIFKNNM